MVVRRRLEVLTTFAYIISYQKRFCLVMLVASLKAVPRCVLVGVAAAYSHALGSHNDSGPSGSSGPSSPTAPTITSSNPPTSFLKGGPQGLA